MREQRPECHRGKVKRTSGDQMRVRERESTGAALSQSSGGAKGTERREPVEEGVREGLGQGELEGVAGPDAVCVHKN